MKAIRKSIVATLLALASFHASPWSIDKPLDFSKEEKDARNTVQKAKDDTDKTLTKAKEDTDAILTKAREDTDSTLTKAKRDTDTTLTKARQDFYTEWNYFFGTICGDSSAKKKIERKYDQGEISKEERERRLEEIGESSGQCKVGAKANGDGEIVEVTLPNIPAPISTEQEKEQQEPDISYWQPVVDVMHAPLEGVEVSLKAWLDQEDSQETLGIGTISRSPGSKNYGPYSVLVPSRQGSTTATAVKPPRAKGHPVIVAFETFKNIAEFKRNAENNEKLDSDYQRLRTTLGPTEVLHMSAIYINGVYTGMAKRSQQLLLPQNSSLERIDVYPVLKLPINDLTIPGAQHNLKIRKKIENLPEEERQALLDKLNGI